MTSSGIDVGLKPSRCTIWYVVIVSAFIFNAFSIWVYHLEYVRLTALSIGIIRIVDSRRQLSEGMQMGTIIPLFVSLFLLLSLIPSYVAVFNIPPGGATSLVAAIKTANGNGQDSTIKITGTYILTTVNYPTEWEWPSLHHRLNNY
jgi:hypothetical protein